MSFLVNYGAEQKAFALENPSVIALKSEVRKIFPSLEAVEFALTYADDEGDQVTIGSDFELKGAMESDSVSRHNKPLGIQISLTDEWAEVRSFPGFGVKSEIANLQAALQMATATCTAATDQITSLQQDFDKKKKELAEEKATSQLRQQALSSALHAEQAKLVALHEKHDQAAAALAAKQAETQQQAEKIAQLEAECKQAEQARQTAENAYTQARKAAEESHAAFSLREQAQAVNLASKDEELRRLKTMLADLTLALEKSRSDLAKMEVALESEKRARASAEVAVESEKKARVSAEESRQHMSCEVLSNGFALENKDREMGKLRETIKHLNVESAAAKEAVAQLHAELIGAQQKLTLAERQTNLSAELRGAQDKLSAELRETQDKLHIADAAAETLAQRVVQLNTTVNEMQAKIDVSNKREQELTDQCTTLERKLSEQITQTSVITTQVTTQLNTKLASVEKELIRKTRELNDTQIELKQIKLKHAETLNQLNEALKQMNESRVSLELISKNHTEAHARHTQLCEMLKQVQEESQQKLTTQSAALTTAQIEKEESERKLTVAQAQVQALREEVTALKANNNNITNKAEKAVVAAPVVVAPSPPQQQPAAPAPTAAAPVAAPAAAPVAVAPAASREHTGYRCDGCNVCPIVGARYHCMLCQDFDLCEECEARERLPHATHRAHHGMLKINVPTRVPGIMPPSAAVARTPARPRAPSTPSAPAPPAAAPAGRFSAAAPSKEEEEKKHDGPTTAGQKPEQQQQKEVKPQAQPQTQAPAQPAQPPSYVYASQPQPTQPTQGTSYVYVSPVLNASSASAASSSSASSLSGGSVSPAYTVTLSRTNGNVTTTTTHTTSAINAQDASNVTNRTVNTGSSAPVTLWSSTIPASSSPAPGVAAPAAQPTQATQANGSNGVNVSVSVGVSPPRPTYAAPAKAPEPFAYSVSAPGISSYTFSPSSSSSSSSSSASGNAVSRPQEVSVRNEVRSHSSSSSSSSSFSSSSASSSSSSVLAAGPSPQVSVLVSGPFARAGPPAGEHKGNAPNMWVCEMCTYQNHEALEQCEICQAKAPLALSLPLPLAGSARWGPELKQLAELGFTDQARCLELLDTYAGDLSRVIVRLTN